MSQFCNIPGCYKFGQYCKLHGFTERDSDEDKRKKEWPKVRDRHLKDNPICEVKGCCKLATSVHHKRGRIGENRIKKEDLMSTCDDHHREIEDNPDWAKANGYSLSRLNN